MTYPQIPDRVRTIKHKMLRVAPVVHHRYPPMIMVDKAELDAIWGGRLELRVRPGTSEYAKGLRGGFTTVLVRCSSASEFLSVAGDHIKREGFDIGGIEKLFPLSAGQFEINDVMADLVQRTRDYPVQWTTFHMFAAN